MKQEELFIRLSEDLEKYTTLNVDAEWPFGWDLRNDRQRAKKPDKPIYDIRRDKRLRNLLKPIHGDANKIRYWLQSMATTIVAGLSQYSVYTPEPEDVDELLKETELTAREMNDYANALPDEDRLSLGTYQIRSITLILHRVLWDTMCEGCGLTGWSWEDYRAEQEEIRELMNHEGGTVKKKKSNRRQQHIRKGKGVSAQRLKKAVDYLTEQRLLQLDSLRVWNKAGEITQEDMEKARLDAQKEYEDFFCRYALLMCKRVAAISEFADMRERADDEYDRINRESDKILRQTICQEQKEAREKQNQIMQKRKGQMKKNVMIPVNLQKEQDILSLPRDSNPAISQKSSQNELLVSSVLRALNDGSYDNIDSLLNILYESAELPKAFIPVAMRINKNLTALNTYIQMVSNSSLDRLNETAILKSELMKKEYEVDVAESAFIAIMLGDEVYKLTVGCQVFADLGELLGLPDPTLEVPELDDEDEWDEYCYPSDNGKLAQAIVRNTDIALYDIIADNGDKKTGKGKDKKATDAHNRCLSPLKLSAVIAHFAGCPCENEIYIRKSHLAAFRELGYSERKARDFAIIAAVLSSSKQAENCYRYKYYTEPENEEGRNLAGEDHDTAEITETEAAKQQKIAEQRCKSSERENQMLRHEIADLRRKQADFAKQMEKEIRKRDELIELYERSMEDPEIQEEEETSLIFPFRTSLRVVLFGGFNVFHQEIVKLIPDIRVVPCTSHIDLAPFRSADIIFLQINKTSHSNYWSVIDIAKNMEIPFFHLNYASARRCAVDMVSQIQKIERKQKSPSDEPH